MVIRNCDLTQVHRITNGFLHSGIFCVMTTSLLNKSTYLQVLPEWNVLQNQSWVICTHIVLLVCSYTLQCADINVTQNTMCIRLTTERSYHHPLSYSYPWAKHCHKHKVSSNSVSFASFQSFPSPIVGKGHQNLPHLGCSYSKQAPTLRGVVRWKSAQEERPCSHDNGRHVIS